MNPEICVSRVAKRGRQSENSVDSGYIYKLHEQHEEWFSTPTSEIWTTEKGDLGCGIKPAPVLILDSDHNDNNIMKCIDFINKLRK